MEGEGRSILSMLTLRWRGLTAQEGVDWSMNAGCGVYQHLLLQRPF